MKSHTQCRDVACNAGVAERPRYYARQIVTPDDLTLEQDYFRSKLRLHNRMLHGWGVVCGARVCLVPHANGNGGNGKNGGAAADAFEPWKVMVKPGYILGPYGDEINIDCARVIDLRSAGVMGVTGEACAEGSDPWCSEVFEARRADRLYIAVRYREVAMRPVRVAPSGCGCDDSRCENSRLRDGYEIAVLTECPEGHAELPDFEDAVRGPIPDCPPCPEGPWVGLAAVEVDEGGRITKIDNCACRRMVLSAARLWWRCEAAHKDVPAEPEEPTEPEEPEEPEVPDKIIRVEVIKPNVFVQGEQGTIVIAGSNLDRVAAFNFGDDIKIPTRRESPDVFDGVIEISATAKPGPRELRATTKDRREIVLLPDAITIKSAGDRPPLGPVPEPTPVRRSARRKKE